MFHKRQTMVELPIRLFDIVLSLFALLLFLPLLLPIMLILRVTGEGEVFYCQKRVGINERNFWLLKFATMVKNSADIGTGTLTLKDDPRVLPFGKFLRKTKLNELPQLFNVLIGDMSLIGPRPLTRETFNLYNYDARQIISSTKPGLSGVGSIVFRNEENFLADQVDPKIFYATKIAPSKEALEIWFVSNKSISLYFSLILTTIYVVLRGDSLILFKLYPSLPVGFNEDL